MLLICKLTICYLVTFLMQFAAYNRKVVEQIEVYIKDKVN